MIDQLQTCVEPSRVLSSLVERVAYSCDASIYRMVPQAVVRPVSIDEMRRLFAFSHNQRIPLTFRAGGTSLCGQSLTDGVLVDIARYWRELRVEDEGRHVRVQPGVIGGMVNARLRPHRRKIGPDPASLNAAMMGGILANNAAGMCCAIRDNAYHTLHSMTVVLPNGAVVENAVDADFGEALLAIRRKVLESPDLVAKIQQKYRWRNTTGYALNAFVDFDSPLDILRHLMIGSEGTLGFIAEAVLNTIPDPPLRHVGLLYFADLSQACEAVAPLKAAGANALEVLDRASLRCMERAEGVPQAVGNLPAQAAAMLFEFQCQSEQQMAAARLATHDLVRGWKMAEAPTMAESEEERHALWSVRKGLYPTVGATRPPGTTVITEDFVFPLEVMASGVLDLQRLLTNHGYHDAVVFGHARDGNLHFLMSQSFNDPESVQQYARLTDAFVDLVLRYGGALKGEHGTGRNVAPFVQAEWGPQAYAIMQETKALFDPHGILNPGIIINRDPRAHLSHLKTMPLADVETDKCIECGFCETHCPSRDLTLTPRQRIIVRREMRRDGAAEATLAAEFRYLGVDTCATDGMCATACPVGIDTGKVMKQIRAQTHGPLARWLAMQAACNYRSVEPAARLALSAGHAAAAVLGPQLVDGVARALGMPGWVVDMPKPASVRFTPRPRGMQAVYFPSCLTRIMAPASGGTLVDTLLTLAGRADYALWVPAESTGHCCGMTFSSKGYEEAAVEMTNRTLSRLWEWSEAGRWPIVTDTTSCAYTLRTCQPLLTAPNRERWERLRLLDAIEFAHDVLLPRLQPRTVSESVVLHPTCSAIKLGLCGKLYAVARCCAAAAVVPHPTRCCGFAGDRGLLFPELTAAATREEAQEVLRSAGGGGYSSGRTCELALSMATGRRYDSFLMLLERATRP